MQCVLGVHCKSKEQSTPKYTFETSSIDTNSFLSLCLKISREIVHIKLLTVYVNGVSVFIICLAANTTRGWCPLDTDKSPVVEIKLSKPLAVGLFQFYYLHMDPQHPEKRFLREFELQYIAPTDSSKLFRTYAPVSQYAKDVLYYYYYYYY